MMSSSDDATGGATASQVASSGRPGTADPKTASAPTGRGDAPDGDGPNGDDPDVDLLTVAGVAKRYGPVVALRDAELHVAPGQIHALLGANGAGKSTLVKILTGVVSNDRGTIHVDGQQRRFGSPTDARGAGLAPVFQDPALAPDLTVAQNLRLTSADLDAVHAHLATMGLADLPFRALVGDLPLALLRMVDLARALSFMPRLLLLDEITAALPADLADRVFEVMRTLRSDGRSVLFISHRLAEVSEICDIATVLRDGRTVAVVDPRVGGHDQMVQAMMGASPSELSARATRPPTSGGPAAIEARNLSVTGRLHGVDLAVRPGEILGLVALEGQGQEVLFDVLAGDRRPDDGTVVVGGEPLRARSPYDAIRRGVALVPSDRLTALLPQRSVRENLAAAMYNRISRWGPLNAARERAGVDRAIARLDIDTRAQSQVQRLSGGNQQKVTIGRWLAAGFTTLLCFDPTRGIDVGTKQQIYGLLRELAAEGAAVLLYTSELQEVPIVCDRVAVLYDGRIVHTQAASNADEQTLLTVAHGLDPTALPTPEGGHS